jgi:hypothetical protein
LRAFGCRLLLALWTARSFRWLLCLWFCRGSVWLCVTTWTLGCLLTICCWLLVALRAATLLLLLWLSLCRSRIRLGFATRTLLWFGSTFRCGFTARALLLLFLTLRFGRCLRCGFATWARWCFFLWLLRAGRFGLRLWRPWLFCLGLFLLLLLLALLGKLFGRRFGLRHQHFAAGRRRMAGSIVWYAVARRCKRRLGDHGNRHQGEDHPGQQLVFLQHQSSSPRNRLYRLFTDLEKRVCTCGR